MTSDVTAVARGAVRYPLSHGLTLHTVVDGDVLVAGEYCLVCPVGLVSGDRVLVTRYANALGAVGYTYTVALHERCLRSLVASLPPEQQSPARAKPSAEFLRRREILSSRKQLFDD